MLVYPILQKYFVDERKLACQAKELTEAVKCFEMN